MNKKAQYSTRKSKIIRAYVLGPLLLLLTVGVVVFGIHQVQVKQSLAQSSNCSVSTTDYGMSNIENEFVDLLNNYRKQNGLSPVKLSPKLAQSAAWMARDMADKNYMAHTDKLGRDPFVRMGDCGYSGGTMGENIAYGQSTAQAVFDAWNGDAGHRDNMLGSQYTVIGLAAVASSNGRLYWANDFGGTDDSASGTVPDIASNPQPTTDVSAGGGTTNPQPTDSGGGTSNPQPTFSIVGDCAANGNCPTAVPGSTVPGSSLPGVLPGGSLPGTSTGAGGGGTDFLSMFISFIQQILQLLKSNGVI